MRSLRLALLAAFGISSIACSDDDNGTGPEVDRRAISLAVGEVRTISPADTGTVRINGGASGGEFTLVTLYALSGGVVPLEVSGEQLTVATGPPMPRLGAPGVPSLATLGARTERFQAHLNELERDALVSRIAATRATYAGRIAVRPALSAVPTIGAHITINTSVVSACSAESMRTGRVVAVTQNAVIIADEANPAGGFTDAEYAEMGQGFDAVVHPTIVENFGAPSDIDANGGRTLVFFTRAVNELTPAGSDGWINGFFFYRDLLAKSGADACPGSNEAELLYVLAPDPNGEVNGNVRTKAVVRTSALGNMAHLSQYLVNASRRLFVNDAPTIVEEAWLNAGLSQIAQELVFYKVSGLAPRRNLGHQSLRSSQTIEDATNAFQIDNLRWTMFYLRRPESVTPFNQRGATWQFLRYAADRSSTPERTFWFNLVNSTTTGIDNVAATTGMDFFTLLREWAMAQYTDDAGFAVTPAFQHPSWNFRSVLSALTEDATFPLATHVLSTGGPLTLTLAGGGAAYLRFGVASGRVGLIRATTGGAPPSSDVSLSVVRTK